MSVIRIFCEGPDDVSALARIAQDHFGAARDTSPVPPSIAARPRQYNLSLRRPAGAQPLRIVAPGEGASKLVASLCVELRALPPQEPGDPERIEKIAVVFDPDDAEPDVFIATIAPRIAALSPGWTATPHADIPGAFWLDRTQPDAARIYLRVIPWLADGPVLDGLPDRQNLERVVCRVLGRTHPDLETLVADWLTQISAQRALLGRPDRAGWKAAMHLWAAPVGESASENAMLERFLGQYDPCKPHVPVVLKERAVFDALASVLAE